MPTTFAHIVMPRVVQTPSPNYTPRPISHDLFILHDQEGHTLPSVSWLCDPRANASAHLCLSDDGATVYQLVPLQYKAWAQCAGNGRGISLEMPGFAAKGFSDDLLRVSARIAAWVCLAYSIPPVWAKGGLGRGVCCHHDGGAAWGGHTDVGDVGGSTWQRFMSLLGREYDAMASGPLPAFALNGAPGPHEVEAPAFVPAVASHGGAARNEPGDIISHLTPSGYVAHSIAALQADLNDLGAFPPLLVDGAYGPATQRALRAFQTTHGLVQDGVIGPASWAAIDAALTKKAA